MDIDVLATGSTGNAVLIAGCILIDIGVPYKLIQPYERQIRIVLLTHAHSDHWKESTARALQRARPGVRWGCREWMVPCLRKASITDRSIDLYKDGVWYNYGIAKIKPDTVPHNVPNTGYHIYAGGERCFYATDCSSLEMINAYGYDLLAVEGNHGEEEIQERIREKRYAGVYAYEAEAARNHLSREQALDWIARNSEPNTRYVLLHEHIEREN